MADLILEQLQSLGTPEGAPPDAPAANTPVSPAAAADPMLSRLQALSQDETAQDAPPMADVIQQPDDDPNQLRTAVQAAADITPEKALRGYHLAKQTGLPIGLTSEYADDVEQAATQKNFNPTAFMKSSPVVARWLAEDPAHVALLREDAPKMGKLEAVLANMSNQFRLSELDVEGANYGWKGMLGTRSNTDEALAALREEQMQEIRRPEDLGLGTMGKLPGSVAGMLPLMGRSLGGKVLAAATGAGIGALAGSETGPGAVAPAAVGAGIGWKSGSLPADFYNFAGQSYNDLEKFKDEKGRPLDHDVAAGAAVLTGLASAAINLVPLHQALDKLPLLKQLSGTGIKSLLKSPTTRAGIESFLRDLGKNVLAGGAAGGGQAYITDKVKELASAAQEGVSFGEMAHRLVSEKAVPDTLAHMAEGATTGAAAGVAFDLVPGASKLNQDLKAAREAHFNADSFKALGEAGQENKFMQALPEEAQKMVLAMKQEHGGDDGKIDQVYVPVQAWNDYWASKQADPREVATEVLGDPKAYDQANRGGENLSIPMEAYATKLAPTEHNAFFQDALKLNPNKPSRMELASFMANQESLRRLAATPDESPEEAAQLNKVGDEQYAQAMQANNGNHDVAELHSQAVRGLVKKYSRETGLTPDEFWDQHRLEVITEADAKKRAEEKVQAQTLAKEMDDAQRQQLMEATAKAGGLTPVMDAIRQAGGIDWAKMQEAGYKGELTDLNWTGIFKKGGHALDRITEKLHEAGVLDKNDANELFEKLDAESRAIVEFKGQEGEAAYRNLRAQTAKGKFYQEPVEHFLERAARDLPEEEQIDKYAHHPLGGFNEWMHEENPTSEEAPFVAHVGVEGVKFANDKTGDKGHSNGNQLYRAAAAALAKAAPGVARRGGDFQLGHIKDQAMLDAVLAQANEAMPERLQLGERMVNGKAFKLTGALGKNFEQAGANHTELKQDLERNKLRAERGSEPLKAGEVSPGEASPIEQIKTPVPEELAQRFREAPTSEKMRWLRDKDSGMLSAAGEKFLDEVAPRKFKASLDLNDIKAFNNTYGYAAGDKLLRSFESAAKALQRATGEDFALTRRGGDEYGASFDDHQKLTDFVLELKQALRENIIEFKDKQGATQYLEGVEFGHGIGENIDAAEAALKASKPEKKDGQPAKILGRVKQQGAAGLEGQSGENSAGLEVGGSLQPRDQSVQPGNEPAAAGPSLGSGDEATSGAGSQPAPGFIAQLVDRITSLFKNPPEQDPARPENKNKLFQTPPDQPAPRGSLEWNDDLSRFTATMLAGADPSTLAHEFAHYFGKVLEHLAAQEDASDVVKSDYASLRDLAGAKEGEKLTDAHHETIAKSWERYLLEGQAPTENLKPVFWRMRQWMLSVYSSIKGLNAPLSPEVRGVFDRLLASQDEVDQARKANAVEPMFKDPKGIGMNPEEAQRYQAAVRAEIGEAEDKLMRKLIKEKQREKAKWWADEKAKLKEQAAKDLNGDLPTRARSILETGKLPDGSKPDDILPPGMAADKMKLDRKATEEVFGKEATRTLPRTIFTKEGGMHPDQAAEILGFFSGEEMLGKVKAALKAGAAVEDLAEKRMREKFPGLEDSGQMQTEALNAVMNEKRGQVLRMELEALAQKRLPTLKGLIRKLGRRVPPSEEIRAQVKNQIDATPVGQLKPGLYARVGHQAGNESFEHFTKGDMDAAFESKLRQNQNYELYRRAVEAKGLADKMAENLKRMGLGPAQATLGRAGQEYLDQVNQLLEKYDLRKSISGRQLQKRQGLLEWVNQKREQGKEISVSQDLLDTASKKHYRQMTLPELKDLHDTIQTISQQAKLKGMLIALKDHRDLQNQIDEMQASTLASHKLVQKEFDHTPKNLAGMVKAGVEKFGNSLRRMEPLFEYMDGNKAQGPWWNNFFKPMVDAEAKKATMSRESSAQLEKILSAYTDAERKDWFTKKISIPALKTKENTGVFTKSNILAMMLNHGNEYNLDAMLQGEGWDRDAMRQAMDMHATKKDWDTVQALWDHIDTLWPESKKLEEDLNGVAPEKVPAVPVETVHGTYKGGYYPVLFDPNRRFDVEQWGEKGRVQDLYEGKFGTAMTKHSHLIAREGTGGRPLSLQLSGLTTHLNQVIHDLAFRRAVIDGTSLIDDSRARGLLENVAGKGAARLVKPWLKSLATDRGSDFHSPLDGLLGAARGGSTIAGLGLRLTTGLVHGSNFPAAANEIGGAYLRRGIAHTVSSPAAFTSAWKFITDNSHMMAERFQGGTFDREVHDRLERLDAASLKGQNTRRTMERAFLSHIGFFDRVTAMPVWKGAYERAMDGVEENIGKGDHAAAVDYADRTVRLIKGSGSLKDLSAMERGPELQKLFTMFYSQMSVRAQQLYKLKTNFELDRSIPKLVAGATLAWFVPAVLEKVIKGHMPSTDDDPEKWVKWLAESEAAFPAESIPIVRDVVNAAMRYAETGRIDFEGSPEFGFFTNMAQVGGAVVRAIEGGEGLETKDYKALAELAGVGLRLPIPVIWRTVSYFYDWMQGDYTPGSVPQGLYEGLVTGKRNG